MTDKPSRTRFIVALWLCAMAAVLYLDRVCWGKAVKPIQTEFNLSNTEMSCLMMAFQAAYGLFEIPSGRWGERLGARAVLTRITLCWSAFTALTGACTGFTSLLVVRFLFGAGEAGAYPIAARILTRWFPTRERGRVQGVMLSVSLIGGSMAPALTAYLIDAIGWRGTFAVFGAVGVVWSVGFWLWFRDDPAAHSQVNAAELDLIRSDGGVAKPTTDPVPWRTVVRNSGVWVLCIIIMCSSFNSYFYFNWFPGYLESAHQLANKESGWLTSLALFGGAVGMISGGFIADLIRKQSSSPVIGRRIYCATAFTFAAGFLAVAVQCETAFGLALCAAASCMCVQSTLPTWWSAAIEQCGRHVGPIFGMMNMMGMIGAMISLGFVGVFADWRKAQGFTGREAWDPMFNVYVGVLLLGAISWATYRFRPIEK